MGVRIRKHPVSEDYYCYINYKGFRQAVRVGKDRRQAEQTRLALLRKLATGEFQFRKKEEASSGIPTLREYFETLKESHLENSVRPSTAESYQENFRLHILPVLGDVQLTEISSRKISEFIKGLMAKRGKGNNHRSDKRLSKNTIRLQIAYLRKVLNRALKDGLIGSNPASRVGEEYRQARNLHEEINPLLQSEIEMYQRAASEEPAQYYLFLQTAIQAGLRVGELCGLNWNDIDFEKRRINVRRTINKDEKIGPPKSRKGVRFVRMNDFLFQEFRKWKQMQHEQYGKVEFVFCSLSGKSRININQIRKTHAGILQRSGLRRIRLHDLRHTYATFLLQKGSNIAWVSRQMGHSSIQVTIDTYFHHLPDEDDRDAAFLNEFPSGD